MGDNFIDFPICPVVKLQYKAIQTINDVPLMEPITPNYESLHSMKFPDIVKHNPCLFMITFIFINIRSASSDLVVIIESFITTLRRFCPTVIYLQMLLE